MYLYCKPFLFNCKQFVNKIYLDSRLDPCLDLVLREFGFKKYQILTFQK